VTKEQGVMNYTIDDIAKELGMSKTTVSRAISGKGRISNATRERVTDFIKQINYTPSAAARSLATSRTYNIGLVFPSDSSVNEMPYFQDVLMGVSEAALEYDYDTLVILADNYNIRSLERSILNKKVDAFIVTRCIKNSRIIDFLKKQDKPYVVLGNPMDDKVLYADNDNRNAARRMMESLENLHMKKFALIGGDEELFVSQSRLKGYIDGLKKNGLEVDESLIFLNLQHSDKLMYAIDTAIEKKVDCIVCMDDVLCNSTLVYLQNKGINVPSDLKLASFYDSRLLSNHKPSITSLYFDSKFLGAQGVNLLMRKINGEAVNSLLVADFNIQMRESTRNI